MSDPSLSSPCHPPNLITHHTGRSFTGPFIVIHEPKGEAQR